jgi:hypothetical protein
MAANDPAMFRESAKLPHDGLRQLRLLERLLPFRAGRGHRAPGGSD